MAETAKLGTADAQLGNIQLAYTGAPEQKPSTGTQTGRLGTANSLLGAMRPALGEAEGGGGGAIVNTDANSVLSLSVEATVAIVRSAAAVSEISLTDSAGRNNLPSVVAESAISLVVDAGRNNLLDASADSTLALDVVAEIAVARTLAALSEISLGTTASTRAVRSLTAESTLELTDQAMNTGRTIFQVAAGSDLGLTAEAATAVARALTAVNTLELTDEARRNNLPNLEAESTISLTSEADRNGFIEVSAESAISLVSQARYAQHFEVVAESVISLESTAHQIGAIVSKTAASELSLTDEALCTHVIGHRGECEDWLELWDEATVSVVRTLSAESVIELAQSEHTARPWYVSANTPVQTIELVYDAKADDLVEQITGLDQTASAARPLTAAAHHSIPLHQSASAVRVKPTAIAVSADSVLELLGEVRINPNGGDAGDWLVLLQEASVEKCKLVRSRLDLSQEAAVIVSVPRSAASALGLRQAATYSIVSRGSLQNYTPFVGEGPGDTPAPPSVTIGPPPHVALPFRLFYPAEGVVTDSVTLRAPNLGNKDRLSFNRILRETRGGTLIVFADPIWPKIQTLVLTFSGLRNVQTQQFLAFLNTHLGEEIGLLDWEGRAWRGIVTSPTEPVVQDGKDSFSASLEFEGDLVPA